MGRKQILSIACCFISCTAQNSRDVAFSAMKDLELDLGSSYGLSPWTMDAGKGVAQSTVQNVMSGAQKRNPESLYFLGLLRLYGQGGLPEDHAKGMLHEKYGSCLKWFF
jgi:hypothetical protein